MSTEPLKIGEQTSVDLKDCIHLGKLVGTWGVKGWLKVFSYTRPRKNIGQYKHWLLVHSASNNRQHNKASSITNKAKAILATSVEIKKCKEQGQNIVALIDGINYRDQAESLFGLEVYIEKSQLKPLKQGEFYWSDMIGCEVVNTQAVVLGNVSSIMETGANDVLVVQQDGGQELIEHLIPYSDEIVLEVNVEKQSIQVEWGEDYLVQEQSKAPRKKKQTNQERAEEVRLQKLADKKAEESS